MNLPRHSHVLHVTSHAQDKKNAQFKQFLKSNKLKVQKKKVIPSDNIVNRKMNIYKDAISTIYQENIDNCINNLKMSEVFDQGPEMLDQRGVRRPKTQQQTRLEVRTPDLT